ncbi:regulatory signaling modulator protein AmpE, partial [Yersinia intermedia]
LGPVQTPKSAVSLARKVSLTVIVVEALLTIYSALV